MALKGQPIPVERGTLTFPWGVNRHVIDVNAIEAYDSVEPIRYMGPNMQGFSSAVNPQATSTVKVIGSYTASSGISMFGISGLFGSATIQFGSGESWSGTVFVVSSKFVGGYNSKKGVLEMIVEFTNPTKTPIPAGA